MHFIFNILVSISLLLFPISASRYIRKVCKIILSNRLSRQIGSSKSIYLETPFYVRGYQYIHIGECFSSGPGFRIECWDKYQKDLYNPSITIGNNVCFNYRCHVGAINKIIIGDNVLIGSQVLITDHSHGESTKEELGVSPAKRKLYSKGPVIIGDNVWIGEGACILSNVTIGNNSIIGANSVVTHDVPPFCVVGVNPAKIIRQLNDI